MQKIMLIIEPRASNINAKIPTELTELPVKPDDFYNPTLELRFNAATLSSKFYTQFCCSCIQGTRF